MERPFENAKIVLDEPRAIYYAGQLLSGHIECELSQSLNFTGINVTFLGEAVTKWTETETEEYNGVRTQRYIRFQGREEFFNYTQCLYGGGYVNQLPAGSHKLPFQYRIPPKVPSTYSTECGHVKYSVTAYVDYPDARMEREMLIKVFDVVAPMDLNTDEGKAPLQLEFEEMYSCCCSSNPLHISIRLPVRGYCPGQTMPITLIAKNDTNNVEVKTVVFQLVKKVAYRTSEPPSQYAPPDEVLATLKTRPVLTNSLRESTYDMVVPDMIAPNLDNCGIIDMGFALKVTVKLSGCNDDIEDESEIILGLKPIPGSPGWETYKHPMADSLPTAPIPEAPPANMIDPQVYPASNAAYPNANFPYSNSNPPYSQYVSVEPPYPDAKSYSNTKPPYPGADSPYQGANLPYPGANSPYPGANSPYPNANQSYPKAHSPYSNAVPQYPDAKSPYSNEPPPYPNTKVENQNVNVSFSSKVPPYPTSNSPLSNVVKSYNIKIEYENADAPSSKMDPPYPKANSSYSSGEPPYPTEKSTTDPPPDLHTTSPYPSADPPYPNESSPNPNANPPYPLSPSHPNPKSAYLASTPTSSNHENVPLNTLRSQGVGFFLPRSTNSPNSATNPPAPTEIPKFGFPAPPYPMGTPNLSSSNPPYPTGTPNTSNSNPPYPMGTPNLSNSNPPYPTGTRISNSNPPYPTGTSNFEPPYPTSVSEPNAHTPLMQNYPSAPSAPPPSS